VVLAAKETTAPAVVAVAVAVLLLPLMATKTVLGAVKAPATQVVAVLQLTTTAPALTPLTPLSVDQVLPVMVVLPNLHPPTTVGADKAALASSDLVDPVQTPVTTQTLQLELMVLMTDKGLQSGHRT
jgi:hypothetical protein